MRININTTPKKDIELGDMVITNGGGHYIIIKSLDDKYMLLNAFNSRVESMSYRNVKELEQMCFSNDIIVRVIKSETIELKEI